MSPISHYDNITAIIATYEREELLISLLASIEQLYPSLKCIVVDASITPYMMCENPYIRYIPISKKGISLQRNIALEQVTTDYFLLLDDDYRFTEKTDILQLLNTLLQENLDIVGGKVKYIGSENYNFHGTYQVFDSTLFHFVENPIEISHEYKKFDTIFNFFLANTASIKKMGGWDNHLKFAREHDDFFLNAQQNNLNTSYLDTVEIDHLPNIKHHGGLKSIPCIEYFCKKRAITNKIEIRPIKRNDEEYISYHNCIMPHSGAIPSEIQNKIRAIYGNLPIKVT